MGMGSAVARSTLADANENRDWRIFADFAQTLIRTALKLYASNTIGIKDVRDLYALDSTTIDRERYAKHILWPDVICSILEPWDATRKKMWIGGVVLYRSR